MLHINTFKLFESKTKMTPDELGTELLKSFQYETEMSSEDLINAGANINIQDADGYTPLILAVRYKEYDIVKLLIKKGANLDVKSNGGTPALMWAAIDRLEILKLLINAGADLTIKSSGVHYFLYYAKGDVLDWLNTEEAQEKILSKAPSLYKEFIKQEIELTSKIQKKYSFGGTGIDLQLL